MSLSKAGNPDPSLLATLNHLQRCANLLKDIPQCRMSVNYSLQTLNKNNRLEVTNNGSAANKICASSSSACKFCFQASDVAAYDNKDLIRPHCETCGRPLGVIKNQAAGGGSGIVKSSSGTIEKDKSGGASISNYHGSDSKTAPGKKRKRLKDKNAGLSIPALVAKPAASATAAMSSARKKLENKSRLQMMLKQQSTVAQQKKDTALQNFLKLV